MSLGVFSCSDGFSSGPEEGQVARAKALTDDLLEVVRGEYAKVKAIVHQQQMELHQAQMQYASYGMMGVCAFSIWRSSPYNIIFSFSDILRVTRPPLHQRRLHHHHPVNNHHHHLPMGLHLDQEPPLLHRHLPTWTLTRRTGTFHLLQDLGHPYISQSHRAAYGYDVNSPEFKEWQASQMAQYNQYYASQGYTAPGSDAAAAGGGGAAVPAPPPSEPAPPPPPPT